VIAAATLAALAVGVSPCQDPAAAMLCPDLTMAPAADLRYERRRKGRRVVLRMTSAIVNLGPGPAELFAQRTGPRTMTARQVLTDAEGGRHRVVTGAVVQLTSVPTRGGDYWKFHDAARFELWSIDSGGAPTRLLRTGPKHNYCLRDLVKVRAGPGVPRKRRFGACNQEEGRRQVTLGTSFGWADVYPATYPGNYINVTGLRGCFAIVQRADPANHILETNEADNASLRIVRLPYRRGRPSRCPQPPVPAR
jgi:hypothetical protein